MAIHTESNYIATSKILPPITSSKGLMIVGMEGVQNVADIVFLVLQETFTSPAGYGCALLFGAGVITLLVLGGGPAFWGLAAAAAIAVIAYIALADPLSRSNDHLKVKEVDKPQVKRIRNLFDESFKHCKTAQNVVMNAQQKLQQNKGGCPKIFVNIDNDKTNNAFGAYCLPFEGLISLLNPNSDENAPLDLSVKKDLLMNTLFESINISRSYDQPHNLGERAQSKKFVDEPTRKKKIKKYANKMEHWEFGTVIGTLKVCRKIINEMGPENPHESFQAKLWRSAAFEYLQSRYQVIINDTLAIMARRGSKILTPEKAQEVRTRFLNGELDFIAICQLNDEYKKAKTLEKLDEILEKIEPDTNTRLHNFKKLIEISTEKSKHTEHYENYFDRVLPKAENTD